MTEIGPKSPLASLPINTWYKALLAISVTVLLMAFWKEQWAIMIAALGAALVGLGEWINHPRVTEITFRYKYSYNCRIDSVLGWSFNVVGVLLICFGAYRMIA